ncbi:hypothetical protein CRE_14526 [Caenorhabditis remanei]|uniref:F-box domain-containing protein n=1 Tax=Caenorhabditis remanei TaxID=31234 RepID=E3M9D3_CAERE|nr:hypothetical protein CRE_14526 [Caenorhabditis remanei]
MSSKRPLSYPNWQCVIKYMNFNTRILLSQLCPELRRLEKSIPLKVHSFDFRCEDPIYLNDSIYQVGIFRRYHNATCVIPEDIQWQNNNGGMRYDVDKYGFPVAPGYLRMDVDYFQNEKRKKNGAQRTERLVYEQPLQNAQKYLIDKLFGGRTQIIIDHMRISLQRDQHFPPGSSLRVQNLGIQSNSFAHYQAKIESVLDYKKYPLETLYLSGEELDHPIVETAQKLIFSGLPSGFPVIRHRNVEFSCYFDITASVQQLVQHILDTKKNIGVCYVFNCLYRKLTKLIDEIKEAHEEKGKLFENSRNDTFSNCAVLQMTELCDLFVYWTNAKMNYLKIEVLPSGSPVSIEND